MSRWSVAVLLGLVGFASACGTSQPDPATGTTTSAADISPLPSMDDPPAATSNDVLGHFMDVGTDADSVFGGLRDADLGCVADQLLKSFGPDEVLALSALGPMPEQVALTVEALVVCDLVLTLVGQGMAEAFADAPGQPVFDVGCLLKGVTSKDLEPMLKTQFEDPFGLDLSDREMTVLLANTPIMGNLMRCRLEAMVVGDESDLPKFCYGLADQVAMMMAAVMEVDLTGGDFTAPSVLANLLGMSDEIFIWLAEEVPSAQKADAVLVRDATTEIAEIMAETLVGIDELSTEEEALSAILAATARVQAEVAAKDTDLDAASGRLREYVTARCGEPGSVLFDLMAGAIGSPLDT